MDRLRLDLLDTTKENSKQQKELENARIEIETMRFAAEMANMKMARITKNVDTLLKPDDVMSGIEVLKLEFEKRDNQIVLLESQVREMSKQMALTAPRLATSEDEIQFLRKDDIRKSNEMHQQRVNIVNLGRELKKAQEETEELRREREQLVVEVQAARAEVAERRVNAEKANMLVAQLVKNTEPLINSTDLRPGLALLQEELGRRELDMLRMKAAMEAAQLENQKLKPMVQQQDDELAWVKKESAMKDKELGLQAVELEDLRNSCMRLERDVRQLRTDLERSQDALTLAQHANVDYRVDAERATLALSQLFNTLEPLSEPHNLAVGLEKVKANKQRQDEFVQATRAEMVRLKQDLVAERLRAAAAEEAAAELRKECEAATAELSEKYRQLADVKIKAQLQAPPFQKESPRSLPPATPRQDTAKASSQREDVLKTELLKAQKEVARLAEEVMQRGQDVSRLNEKVAEDRKELGKLRLQVADLEADKEVRSTKEENAEALRRSLQTTILEKDNEIIRAQSQVQNLKVQLRESERQLHEAGLRMDDMQMLQEKITLNAGAIKHAERMELQAVEKCKRYSGELEQAYNQIAKRDEAVKAYSAQNALMRQELNKTAKKFGLKFPDDLLRPPK
eukprot:TRINITY_DN51317_c0_g1_i1.p1 TRINITY_DN51317_c0_g1~~TRINITY_DN51317_c0_g1_i1.p1  ORF type:complete len:628 (+),score=209.95 TRINITY_DN51317_c0_g1_i1:472-2355(+)